ncbi:MAG: RDD family protein [Thermoanaerobaculia bacterium]
MKRSAPGDADDPLFDLPIDPEQAAAGSASVPEVQEQLPLEPALAQPPDTPGAETVVAVEEQPPDPHRALYGQRWAAGILDLAAHVTVLAAAVAGSWLLGAQLGSSSFLPLAIFTAAFSFVYHVVPLTFWGRTPGMAATGLNARASDGGPLTISQSVQRWLGSIFNVASLGSAFLVSRKRSLADLFSRSTVTSSR